MNLYKINQISILNKSWEYYEHFSYRSSLLLITKGNFNKSEKMIPNTYLLASLIGQLIATLKIILAGYVAKKSIFKLKRLSYGWRNVSKL